MIAGTVSGGLSPIIFWIENAVDVFAKSPISFVDTLYGKFCWNKTSLTLR